MSFGRVSRRWHNAWLLLWWCSQNQWCFRPTSQQHGVWWLPTTQGALRQSLGGSPALNLALRLVEPEDVHPKLHAAGQPVWIPGPVVVDDGPFCQPVVVCRRQSGSNELGACHAWRTLWGSDRIACHRSKYGQGETGRACGSYARPLRPGFGSWVHSTCNRRHCWSLALLSLVPMSVASSMNEYSGAFGLWGELQHTHSGGRLLERNVAWLSAAVFANSLCDDESLPAICLCVRMGWFEWVPKIAGMAQLVPDPL